MDFSTKEEKINEKESSSSEAPKRVPKNSASERVKTQVKIIDNLRTSMKEQDKTIKSWKDKFAEQEKTLIELRDHNSLLRKENKTLKSKFPEKEPDEPEKTPDRFSLKYDDIERLSKGDPSQHLVVFRRLLKGYAVCPEISKDTWIWYNWKERLWVVTSSKGMIPFLSALVAECRDRVVNMHEKHFSKHLLNVANLVNMIENLKFYLQDENNIATKLNKNKDLVPLVEKKVYEISTGRLRTRIKTDYLTHYYDGPELKMSPPLPDTSVLDGPVDSFDMFLKSEMVLITKDPTHKVRCGPLHSAFCDWCDENGYTKLTSRQFTAAMKNLGLDKKKFATGEHWIGAEQNWE
jgi:hypothetical protein